MTAKAISESTPITVGLVILLLGTLVGFAFWTGTQVPRLEQLEANNSKLERVIEQNARRIDLMERTLIEITVENRRRDGPAPIPPR